MKKEKIRDIDQEYIIETHKRDIEIIKKRYTEIIAEKEEEGRRNEEKINEYKQGKREVRGSR